MLKSLAHLKWHRLFSLVLLLTLFAVPAYGADRDEFRRSIFEDGADNEVLMQFGNTGSGNSIEIFDGTVAGGTLIFRLRQNGADASIEAVNGLFLNYTNDGGVGAQQALFVMTERSADPAFGVTDAAAWYVKDVSGEERPFFETSAGTVYDMLLGGPAGTDITELNVNYTAPSDAFSLFDAISIVLDVDSLVPTSEVHAINIGAAGTTSGTVFAIGTEPNVGVIHQHVGVFATPSQTEFAGRFPSGGAWADGVDGETVFLAVDDKIYFGAVAKFGIFEVLLSTKCSKDEELVFAYQHTDLSWKEFTPIDGTLGFQFNGYIEWNSANLTNWKSDSDPGGASASAGYYVSVQRKRNGSATDPIVTTIKLVEPEAFYWDEVGNTKFKTIISDSYDGDGAVDQDYGSADITDHTFTSDGGTAILDGLISTSVGIDGIGAVDLDYGSADITDHTFTTDSTGDAEIVLPDSSIGATELLNFGTLTATKGFALAADGTDFESFEDRIYHVPGVWATIQAGIDAAGADGGGIVKVAPGTYDERPLIDSIGVTLMGSGAGTTIIDESSDTGHAITVTANGTVISNLSVSTNSGGGNNYDAISITAANNTRIQNVSVDSSDRYGVIFNGACAGAVLFNVGISDTDNDGVFTSSTASGISFYAVSFASIGGGSDLFLSHDNGVINGCHGDSGTTRAVSLNAASSEITVVGNGFEGAILDSGTNNFVGSNNT